ncbi:helix-turn-helix domain-containing protein [Chengkuizengella sediminis]|uniref:helix-turn-helix domain-containing protein n=1 Tax=Chengkuizengella sediminis TaxID=1885917 RepID=UPI00138A54EF|nr:helix-turn-helix domain-containing protein [Chengkuizengella sediminis]NDI34931.1 helix-turn-helix domain-containing protein [Chengkuizengella sediminis]
MKICLCVRDELERNGMKWLLSSHHIPYKHLIEATDSQHCYLLLSQHKVDLLIFELDLFSSEELAKLRPLLKQNHTQTVIHTTHKTFDAAHEALLCKAEALFVKPYDTEAWIKTIRQLVKRFKAPVTINKKTIPQHYSAYDLLFLENLESEHVEVIPRMLAVIELDQNNKMEMNFNHLLSFVKQELSEYQVLVIPVENHLVLFFDETMLIGASNPIITLEQILIRLCYQGKAQGFSISAGIGQPKKNMKSIKQAYHEAKNSLTRRFYFGGNQVFSPMQPYAHKQIDSFLSPKESKELVELLESCRHEEIKKWLYDQFTGFPDESGLYPNPETMRIRLTSVLAHIHRFMSKQNIEKTLEHKYQNLFQIILFGEVLFDITQQMLSFCYELFDLIQLNQRPVFSLIVNQLQLFIEENYAKPLTLSDAAKHVNRNSYYISHLFKQETGLSFIEYLQKKRIEEAKKLLEASDLNLSDISVQVGFSDANYFSRVFKKVTGDSPRAWVAKRNEDM